MWKGLEEQEGEIKNKKSSLNFTFGQNSCLILDFAKPNSNKAALVQVFLRFEVVIFNNNFVFYMMNSFCSMTWVAGWILPREIIKRINVFYPVCLKKYLKNVDKHLWQCRFCESIAITHHSFLKMNQTPCWKFEEGWKGWKDKKIKENMKEFLFKIKANELCKLPK